jgi:hypothetical protein
MALALGLTSLLARAAAPGGANGADADLRRLFPERAPIEADAAIGAALWRLELTPEVIAACRPDFSDLRILDARDQPVPFVIDPGPPPRAPTTGIERLPARVRGASRREVPESPAAASRFVETFELEPPPARRAEGEWQLVLEADAPEFVRRLAIEGIRSGAPPERVEGSLFRIRGLADEHLSSPLPSPRYERLRVHLESEELFPLRPRFFFETARPLPATRVLRVPLAVSEPASVDQTGTAGSVRRFALARPAGIVPSALRLQTRTAAFERHVEVYDVARGRPPVRIGEANVFRMPIDPAIEGLELALAPASGQTLEVRIEDGDSPPLADLEFSAVVRAPSLVFAPPAAQQPGVVLYFGGGRVRAPRYDLERLLTQREASRHAPGSLARGTPVRLGPVGDNPQYARTPALAFATRAGAPVDVRLYRHQRLLPVAPSSEGLVRVVLSPADVGVLRGDLGDIRVVDAAGRQWPYLIDREPSADSVPLELGALERGALERGGAASSVPLVLPSAPLVPSALVLEASDAYFDREYHVSAQTLEGKTLELARGRLHREASAAREPIVIELSPARVRSLALEVSDADDSPIRWTSASLRMDVPRLYVLAEPGAYRLLLGNALDAEPSYDVARARELILSVAFQDAPLGPLSENPDYRATARIAAGDAPSRVLLWVALGAAVLVLGGLTLRLARQETPVR